jgi:flagellar hook-associated protein 1 FlgK
MAGLNALLYTARDALTTQSYGLNVAGQNVSNANTPLYVRREAIIETRAFGSQSTGSVVATGLRRAVDVYADRRFFEANSNSGAATQYDSELQQIETVFNDLGGTGLGSSLDAVFKSFQQLAARPTDTTVRAELLDKIDVFASRARQIGDTLATQRTEMLSRARDVATEANRRAAEIAQLNGRIVLARQAGQDAADLIDQRNAKLLDLSGLIDVRTIEAQDGSVMVQSSGTMLVEGSFARSLRVELDADGKLQVLASRMGGAEPDTDITSGLSGGKLAGIKEARDEDLFDNSGRFDTFVFDIATAINDQHRQGVGLDGSTGLNVFDVSSTSEGAARAITTSADVVGRPAAIGASQNAMDLPGGSGNAVLLGKLADVTNVFGGSRTASQAYGDLVGEIGVSRASAKAEVELRTNIFEQTKSVRESTSGVSLDEEMVNLQRYQRAYQAASKVITTVDALLEELMAKVGR